MLCAKYYHKSVILTTCFSKDCYVDLAGGCRLNELKIQNLETSYYDSFRFFRKPVTNTACVYLMSRPLAAHFHAILARRPWLRLIGADWLMNSLFIRLADDGIECVCMHADPTVFEHGTATGEYVSTIREMCNAE